MVARRRAANKGGLVKCASRFSVRERRRSHSRTPGAGSQVAESGGEVPGSPHKRDTADAPPLHLEERDSEKVPGSDAVVESSHGETLKYREGLTADVPQSHEADLLIATENGKVVRVDGGASPSRSRTGHCEPRLRVLRSMGERESAHVAPNKRVVIVRRHSSRSVGCRSCFAWWWRWSFPRCRALRR